MVSVKFHFIHIQPQPPSQTGWWSLLLKILMIKSQVVCVDVGLR